MMELESSSIGGIVCLGGIMLGRGGGLRCVGGWGGTGGN